MSVHDITDKSSNPSTVETLEKLLEQAKRGEIRTLITVIGWNDDSFTHGWVTDKRNTKRRMLGEISLMQYDMLTNVALMDGDTVLAGAL